MLLKIVSSTLYELNKWEKPDLESLEKDIIEQVDEKKASTRSVVDKTQVFSSLYSFHNWYLYVPCKFSLLLKHVGFWKRSIPSWFT